MRGRLQSAAKAGCEHALATHTADTLLSTPRVQLLSYEEQSVSWFSKGVQGGSALGLAVPVVCNRKARYINLVGRC